MVSDQMVTGKENFWIELLWDIIICVALTAVMRGNLTTYLVYLPKPKTWV